jgi:hypothetical protein
LADLQAEFAMKQRALDVLLDSNSFVNVARALAAEWIISDGGVSLAQALAQNVAPRDAHLMLSAFNADQDTLAAWIVEKYVRRGSVDDLMKSVASRLRFGRIEVTHARIDDDARIHEAPSAVAGADWRASSHR